MKLFEKGKIGSVEIKNRIVMAAMGIRGTTDPPDGDWGERVRAYYEARATGGVGLITTEMTFVTQELEPVSKQLLSFKTDKHMASLKALAGMLHSYDCKLSVQLTAGFGRVIPAPIIDEEVPPVSASENTNFFVPDMPEYNSRAMTTEEAADLAQSFGYAAKRAKEAGADCVELHGHEGYLLDQFTTSLWNRRDDHYGGTREKRFNLIREAIEAIKHDAGDDFPIIYRFGITHHLEGGREEEESFWMARELEKTGISAFHIDAGCYETSWWPHPPAYQPPGCMVNLADMVKKITSLPVIAVGRLQYPDVAEKTLEDGKADFIAIGRGLLSEPQWANKVREGRTNELIPCLGCHEGCLWQMIIGEPTSCSLNPITGHEIEWKQKPLKKKKSLLVIGGGPGGIEAARVGAERGFDVTLWEASDRLCGSLWPASKPDFKHDISYYIKYLTGLAERLPVKIELNKRAVKDDILSFDADNIIIATGAEMEPCPFKGNNVISAMEVLNGKVPEGDRIVMMGGGVIACETAVYLSDLRKTVTLLAREDSDDLDMADLYDHNNRFMLLDMLKGADIIVHKGVIPKRLEEGHVIADQNDTELMVAMDTLVFAGRRLPVNSLSQEFKGISNVISIGDCKEPGRIMDAVWGAFNTVREIE